MKRIIESKTGLSNEVLIILIGSIHGNEKEGIRAIERTFQRLNNGNFEINGKIIGIAGNLKAIEAHKRFLDHDLNRCWTDEHIQQCLSNPNDLVNEDKELVELYHLINEVLSEDYKQKFVIDLHTTSADNGNFLVYPGKVDETTIAEKLGLPMITNLDDYLQGTTLLKYYSSEEVVSFAFEGGQIGSPKAIDIHTEGIWQLLQLSGIIAQTEAPKLLIDPKENLPSLLRVIHRHGVKVGDAFKMKGGFKSFQPIAKGELIAEDNNGEITAPKEGRIFMPLYQAAGDDGFFIVEEI
ncbi:succinylglutamate desuccinylase/aspartoacylase family protein [Roseivirga sp.]|uniref:succinylglutamate desuccinylase/aspartoacylase family protein n=1 Tax=Roseivirga sp. TaxID=1964215 RepID=UPI003B8BB3C5